MDVNNGNKIAELKEYIKHLSNELKWLLNAAACWYGYKKCIEIKKSDPFPRHLIVYSMDSALLHARSLYEFFTMKKDKIDEKNKKEDWAFITWKDFEAFGGEITVSPLYIQNINALHVKLMHLKKQRAGNEKIINDKVLCFADDILSMWIQFTKKLTNSELKICFEKAGSDHVEDANKTIKFFDVNIDEIFFWKE